MTIDAATSTRSRRALLVGIGGGLAAWVAAAVGRASPVRAGVDGDVVLNASNLATGNTSLYNNSNGNTVLSLSSYSPGGTGVALSTYSDLNSAVFAHGYAPALPAIFGWSSGESSGVHGYSGHSGAAPKPMTGVYGLSDVGGAAGRGIFGECSEGIGVLGQSSASGVGVRAHHTKTSGVALKVTGKAAFDRSGKLTVLAGNTGVSKTGISLTSATLILATLQSNVAGLTVQGVVTNPAGSSFTIRLNKAPAVDVVVAWMAVN